MPPRGLSLPETAAARVLSGAPVLELELLPESAQAAEPGRPLLLLDAHGQHLASGVADPENGVIRILSREAVESFDLAFCRRRLEKAFALRRALGLADGRSAYRLLHGEGDELSGFAADAYGPYAVLYVYSRGLTQLGRLVAAALLEVAGLRGVVLKLRLKGGAQKSKVRQEIVGESPPEKLVVHELDVPYEVHLLGGLNVGLFTDMREHRRRLGRFARDRRVLNTFAYTGSLSLTAALAGASEVTSVDLSTGVLKWARENFRLSGLDPDEPRFRFEANDVLRFLRAARAAGATYDTIILDPPTYSAARAAGWSMKNDYPDLIAAAASLFHREHGGLLWVSANALRSLDLAAVIDEAMQLAGREARVLEVGGLPPDYPTPLAYPQARYLEVWYLRVV